jgi:DNA-binding winged helix-turn-helix (wHTH) protein
MEQRLLKSYLFGPFKLDLETGYLYREDGEKAELTATPRKILEHMLENTTEEGGTLFTRERIIAAVWGNVAVESATLDKHIGALRKAFGRGDDQSVIETKHREGYRFKLPVRRVYGPMPKRNRPRKRKQLPILSDVGYSAAAVQLSWFRSRCLFPSLLPPRFSTGNIRLSHKPSPASVNA